MALAVFLLYHTSARSSFHFLLSFNFSSQPFRLPRTVFILLTSSLRPVSLLPQLFQENSLISSLMLLAIESAPI